MKKLLSVFITAAFMLLLTSCDSPKATQEPYNFILILGSHANAKELDYSAVASEFEYAAHTLQTLPLLLTMVLPSCMPHLKYLQYLKDSQQLTSQENSANMLLSLKNAAQMPAPIVQR